MKYVIYLDESGNTGNPKFDKDKWNWETQPYFALGSMTIKQREVDKVKMEMLNIFSTYDKELGISKELKSTTSYRFKKEITTDMLKLLLSYDVGFYIDIVNKKFNIVKYINEYCVFPYYLKESFSYSRDYKVVIATDIFNSIPDELLSEFITICNIPIDDEQIPNYLVEFNERLSYLLKNSMYIKQKEIIKKTLLSYKDLNLTLNNLLPIRDMTNKGTEMSLLPHIDSFNNIIASVSTLKIRQNDQLLIYHDKQEQFNQSLIKWTENMRDKSGLSNLNDIQFIESKNDILVQSIDYITGMVLKVFSGSVTEMSLTKDDREFRKILMPVLQNCNVVSSKYEQNSFFNGLKLTPRKTPLPNIFIR